MVVVAVVVVAVVELIKRKREAKKNLNVDLLDLAATSYPPLLGFDFFFFPKFFGESYCFYQNSGDKV